IGVCSFVVCGRCRRNCLFFFFQAEDGIRDRNVTGVQTCALPIYIETGRKSDENRKTCADYKTDQSVRYRDTGRTGTEAGRIRIRSEERRVGKEWRARWRAEQ